MCGIAGFLAKRDGVDVAATLTAMLAALRGRGPDSTGMSLYGAPFQGDLVASAWAGEAGGEATRAAVADGVSEAGFELSDQQYRDGYWRLGLARNGGDGGDGDVAALADAIERSAPGVRVFSVGTSLELLKHTSDARELAQRFGVLGSTYSHAIGHARLATESRVDVNHSHPFWARPFPDVTVVHNGHVTNYYKNRRLFEMRGHRSRQATTLSSWRCTWPTGWRPACRWTRPCATPSTTWTDPSPTWCRPPMASALRATASPPNPAWLPRPTTGWPSSARASPWPRRWATAPTSTPTSWRAARRGHGHASAGHAGRTRPQHPRDQRAPAGAAGGRRRTGGRAAPGLAAQPGGGIPRPPGRGRPVPRRRRLLLRRPVRRTGCCCRRQRRLVAGRRHDGRQHRGGREQRQLDRSIDARRSGGRQRRRGRAVGDRRQGRHAGDRRLDRLHVRVHEPAHAAGGVRRRRARVRRLDVRGGAVLRRPHRRAGLGHGLRATDRRGTGLAGRAVRRSWPGACRRVAEGARGREAVALRQEGVLDLAGRAVIEHPPRSSHVWSEQTLADIRQKAELGRYVMGAFSTTRRVPNFDDLTFIPCTLSRVPLEGYRERCHTRTVLGTRAANPVVLETPIAISGMSFGALSANAKDALGRAASQVGISTTTGDGGMHPRERAASKTLVYQVTPSHYGNNPHHMAEADAVEIVVGQGAKPGTGGVLLGFKVSDEVAGMRDLPPGVDQRSPVRHPDFLGADDLRLKIEELRETTRHRVPIWVKLGACRVFDDVRLAVKAGADVVVIDGLEGASAASPLLLFDHTGVPTLAAVVEAREALIDIGAYGDVQIVIAGGIRTGVDAAKALALGADAVYIATAAMVALNCNAPLYEEDYAKLGVTPGTCRECHTGLCPVGVTTQDPELMARLDVDSASERVVNFLNAMTMEIQMLARACGKSDVHNLEPEDLRSLTLECEAITGVPLVGRIDRH